MAKTLLNTVNAVFKRVGLIKGDAAALTTLTDSARQHDIDVAEQIINEGLQQLYSLSNVAYPNEQAEGTITLATSDRSYALAADLVQMRWPLIDKTNNQYIYKYNGDYNDLLVVDPEQDDTGLPHWGVISPVNGELYLDRAPTAEDNGNVYTYQYDRSLLLSVAADTVPFNDDVWTAMIPVWSQLWKQERRNEFDATLARMNFARAARLLTQVQPGDSWSPR